MLRDYNSISFRLSIQVLLVVALLTSTYQVSATTIQRHPIQKSRSKMRVLRAQILDKAKPLLIENAKRINKFVNDVFGFPHPDEFVPLEWRTNKMTPETSFPYVLAHSRVYNLLTGKIDPIFFKDQLFFEWVAFVQEISEHPVKEIALAMTTHCTMSRLSANLWWGLHNEHINNFAHLVIEEIDKSMPKYENFQKLVESEEIVDNANFIWWVYFRRNDNNKDDVKSFLRELPQHKFNAMCVKDTYLCQRMEQIADMQLVVPIRDDN